MKYAANNLEHFTLIGIITEVNIWIAVVCLIFQSIFWQLVLRKYKLSEAYYFMSLRYFLTLGFGYFLFQEIVNYFHIAGLLIIATGITVFLKGKNIA